jgi:uracil-DNA glycosylase
MIIGQAPGITETEAGRPFNAGSGTRLFKWLTACGFEETAFRAQEYMTSVTKCYPGKSLNGRGDRVPTRAEQHLCESFLEAEIAFVQPDILLPVGRLAINRYWSANKPLRDIIGTEKQTQERWIIPLPHPSGASPWHQNRENRLLIEKALTLIRSHKSRLGI